MLKYLDKDEKKQSRKLYNEVFKDTKKFTDFYFDEYMEKNLVLANVEDAEIFSMMHLNPNHVTINGEDTHLFYIFAVATKEEYRKKGYMEKMMNKAISDLFEKGIPMCYLIPEKAETYSKFGFGTIKEKIVSVDNIEKMEYDVDDFNLKELEEEDIKKLTEFFYDSVASQADFYKTRNREYFLNMIKKLKSENGNVELFFLEDNLVGYAYVSNEEMVQISELICENKYKKVFLSNISKKYSADKIKYFSPELMVRIIRPEKMLKYITLKSDINLDIKIKDNLIPENNRIFSLSSNSNNDEKILLEMDIIDFGKWIFGEFSKNDLPEIVPIERIHYTEIL